MAVDQRFVIQKLQKMEEWLVLYSGATRMPYVVCDEETYNDQIFIFSSEEKMKEVIRTYVDAHIPALAIKVQKKNAPMFFTGLFAQGINEIVFQDGEAVHKLELTKVVNKPDFEKLPVERRPLMNPQLKISASYFLQELRRPGVKPNNQRLLELEEEMSANLYRSQFLMPVDMKEENGEKKVNVLYVTSKEGRKYQPLFSDTLELTTHFQQQKEKKNNAILKLNFEALEKNMIPGIDGYVINPSGMNLILTREQMKKIASYYVEEDESKS